MPQSVHQKLHMSLVNHLRRSGLSTARSEALLKEYLTTSPEAKGEVGQGEGGDRAAADELMQTDQDMNLY